MRTPPKTIYIITMASIADHNGKYSRSMSEVNVRKHEKNNVLQDDTEKIADFKRLNQSSLLRSLVGKTQEFPCFCGC